ncbi:hypothetical protein QD460_31380 [Rhizobium jaguaris]|uniref:hypothetical protein n=1 Tax=Rhizobium jaguaris TaxID=1312183 RepID=UPI0039BEEDB9
MNMVRAIVVAAVAALMASSALAASSFYVAHAPNSKTCTVSETKPDGKTMIQVGRVHASKMQAETAMKSDAACAH